ncbi:MAG: outer membrane lipoprotein chaperone LolA [Pseudomonadota bacterium]
MTRRTIQWAAGLVASALISVGASAQDGSVDRLWTLIDGQSQASGSFEQTIFGPDGERFEDSSGEYAILRPSFFRWQVTDPDEQLIIANSTELWHYDVELATATKRAVDPDVLTPLALLAGRSSELKERFQADVVAGNRYRLTPLYPGAGFASVEVAWEDGRVTDLAVTDRSGQRIVLNLSPNDAPEALSPQDFQFTPPAGVDVFDAIEP